MEIRSKRQFYELTEAGVLGNKPRTWRDPLEAYRAGLSQYGFREVGKTGGGRFNVVGRKEFWDEVLDWNLEHRQFIIDDGAPNHRCTLQGEVQRTSHGLAGFLAVRSGLNMREAIARKLLSQYYGITVHALLAQFMDPSSRDDLDAIWERYPDSVIEFTCFPCYVGVIPRRNTLIWEVRNY